MSVADDVLEFYYARLFEAFRSNLLYLDFAVARA